MTELMALKEEKEKKRKEEEELRKKKEEAEKEAQEERERAKGVSWGMEVDLLPQFIKVCRNDQL